MSEVKIIENCTPKPQKVWFKLMRISTLEYTVDSDRMCSINLAKNTNIDPPIMVRLSESDINDLAKHLDESEPVTIRIMYDAEDGYYSGIVEDGFVPVYKPTE